MTNENSAIYQLIYRTNSFLSKLNKSLDSGKGPFKDFSCSEIHELIDFGDSFDTGLDQADNYYKHWKRVFVDYNALDKRLKEAVPLWMYNYLIAVSGNTPV